MLHVFESTKEVLDAAALFFIKTGNEAIEKQGRFTVALSGGSSPKGLFELLSSEYHLKLDWSKVFFFFGDERYVPADHPDSNALMAKKALFDPLRVDASQIFAMDTSLTPKATAEAYWAEISKHFAPEAPSFDLILLGLGDNAHTASLFPHTKVVNAAEPGVKEIFVEDKQVFRITFTAPLINLARHIAFLVFGSAKADAVQHVFEGAKDVNLYPAQLIQPIQGDLSWFMDEAASSLLKK